VFELEFKLAACAFHTRDVAVTTQALINLVEQVASSDMHRTRMCDAGHLLSQLYVRTGSPESLELARLSCENVLRARSRLIGTDHKHYCESLALMVDIYKRLGNETRAKIYTSMIPKDRRQSLLEVAGAFKPSPKDLSPAPKLAASPALPSSPPQPPVAHTVAAPALETAQDVQAQPLTPQTLSVSKVAKTQQRPQQDLPTPTHNIGDMQKPNQRSSVVTPTGLRPGTVRPKSSGTTPVTSTTLASPAPDRVKGADARAVMKVPDELSPRMPLGDEGSNKSTSHSGLALRTVIPDATDTAKRASDPQPQLPNKGIPGSR